VNEDAWWYQQSLDEKWHKECYEKGLLGSSAKDRDMLALESGEELKRVWASKFQGKQE
jgi:hypothetical protein